MSYYTIAHLVQGGGFYGSEPGLLGLTPDQMTDEVFEYVFGDGPFPDPSPITLEQGQALKREFNYFYPMDIRSSGKDLIPNHLTFAVYNHAALFDEKYWPRSMRANGHLMLNGKKMAKSTGNSLTMRDSVEKFGADASRLALADAGDGIEDANFDEKTANAAILRLHTLMDWSEEMLAEVANPQSNLRHGPKDSYHDLAFEEEINELINVTKSHYEATNYKDALKYGFYELQTARDWYREVTADIGMHADLVAYFIRVLALLVLPIAPHFSEHLWSTLLKEPKSVQLALWPTPARAVDRGILESASYMRNTLKSIRDAETTIQKRAGKGNKSIGPDAFNASKPKAVRIFVASGFPDWQNACVQAVEDAFNKETGKVDDAKVREKLIAQGLGKDKRAMPFVQLFKKRIAQFGFEVAFKRTLPFSEQNVLTTLLPYIKRNLGFVDGEVITVESIQDKKGQPGYATNIIDSAEPGSPGFVFWNP